MLLELWNSPLHPTKEDPCQLSNFTRLSKQGSEEQAIMCSATSKQKILVDIDVLTRDPVITSLNQMCSFSQILPHVLQTPAPTQQSDNTKLMFEMHPL